MVMRAEIGFVLRTGYVLIFVTNMNMMKKISMIALGPVFFSLFLLASGTACQGQMKKRKSPMDTVTQTVQNVEVRITYSQPSKRGRKIFGGLVPYNKVWRTGANEATVLEVSEPVRLAGNRLAPGKYALFTIPGKDSWTVILNSVHNQWGAYNYDESKDVLRFEVKPQTTEDVQEKMRFTISKEGNIRLHWDQTVVGFQLQPAS